MSRATRELVRRGLVNRRENSADKRSPTFELTEAGRKCFGAIRKPISKFIEHLDALPSRRETYENMGAQAAAFEKATPSAHVVRLAHASHDVYRSNEADVLREMNAFISTLP